MESEKKKMSSAKLIALIISIGIHAVIFFYLGRMALDYALPKGEVSSLEMNFDTNQGVQQNTTDVDVVETKPAPLPEPKIAPKKSVVEKPTPEVPEKSVAAKPPKELPSKVETETAEVDQQGTMPVATEIPEDTQKELMEEPEKPAEELPEKEATLDNPPEIIPSTPAPTPEPTPAPVAQAVTDQAYGTPLGNQMEALIPYGTNKSHTYPYMARFRKYEGVVVVHYTVSTSGDVVDAKVMSSSGHSVLDDEAVDTIKTWKFKPMRNEVVYEKYVRFQLKGDAKEAPSLLRRIKK